MKQDIVASAPVASSAASRAWATAILVYAALVGLEVLALFGTFESMARTWIMTTAFNHGPLVPLGSLFLMWRQRDRLAHLPPRPDLLGVVGLAGGLGLWLAGYAGEVMLVQQVGAVGALIALFVAVFGRQIARLLAFPLGFLFFMVPFGQELIPPLQIFTAEFAVRTLRLLGIPVFQDGVLIMTPSGLFEVAEACAGIRFLIANVVIALLFAYLSFRRPWKWVIFMALAFVVPIIANAIRATGIIYIAYLTDNEYAVGVDHLVYGWGFFAVVMLVLLFLGNRMADPVPAEQTRLPPPSGWQPRRWQASAPLLALGMLLAAPAYAWAIIDPPEDPPSIEAAAEPIRSEWPAAEPSGWQPGVAGHDLLLRQSFTKEGRQVDVAIAYYAWQREGSELIQAANRTYDPERWRRTGAGMAPVQSPAAPASIRWERITSTEFDTRVNLSWYWLAGHQTAGLPEALAIKTLNRLFGRHRPAAIVMVSVPFAGDEEVALRTAQAFLAEGFSIDGALSSLAGEP
jgi:exosortase A